VHAVLEARAAPRPAAFMARENITMNYNRFFIDPLAKS
jgi:hypothetical protein